MKKYQVTVNGETFTVEVEELNAPAAAQPSPVASVAPAAPAAAPAAPKAQAPAPKAAPSGAPAGASTIQSPLPGSVLKVLVNVGQSVQAGDVVMVLEAMKMENDIPAPAAGTVQAVHVTPGTLVQTGDVLISLS